MLDGTFQSLGNPDASGQLQGKAALSDEMTRKAAPWEPWKVLPFESPQGQMFPIRFGVPELASKIGGLVSGERELTGEGIDGLVQGAGQMGQTFGDAVDGKPPTMYFDPGEPMKPCAFSAACASTY